MINKNRPESASGASKDTVYPQELLAMSNQQLLDEVDAVMSLECSNENDIQRLEQCLALLQERAPVMETYDAGEEWKELVQEQPLLFQADLKEEQKHGIRKGKKQA